MAYKRPESVLIVIYSTDKRRVLMLRRRDDPDFWQSVTGSLEENESQWHAALREVKEEVGIDIQVENLTLENCHRSIEFELFTHLRYRYAPGITHNLEHWYCLALPTEREVTITEHDEYQWLDAQQAMNLTKSWSNRQAIEEFVIGR